MSQDRPLFKPYTSHKDALGTLLDLIQLQRLAGKMTLDEEELEAFREALKYHDRND